MSQERVTRPLIRQPILIFLSSYRFRPRSEFGTAIGLKLEEMTSSDFGKLSKRYQGGVHVTEVQADHLETVKIDNVAYIFIARLQAISVAEVLRTSCC